MRVHTRIRNKNQRILRSAYWCFLAMLAIWIAAGAVFAQTASTGAIRGHIADASGASMSGVVVEAVSAATGTERRSVSVANGIYTVGLLPPGPYQLRFIAPGFETSAPPPVTVSVTETITFNIKMVVGAQQQSVEVSATVDPLIQTESAALEPP